MAKTIPDEETPPSPWLGRLFLTVFLLTIFGLTGAGIYIHSILHRPAIFTEDQAVIIKPGDGRAAISARLNSVGIEHPMLVMRLEEIRRGRNYLPKAGEFALPKGTSLSSAMDIIHEGQSIQHQFTAPEGWTSAEIIAALFADDRLTGAITPQPAEGTLLPETYAFTRGTERGAVIKRMQSLQEMRFAELWAGRQKNLPIQSLEDAIILASIVEKETGLAAERNKVASVFINRLKAGMRLQSDPTVLYGLRQAGEDVTSLLRRHWEHNSPWNTYRIQGLPITPICNPGEASLQAVLQPEETGYYYFVADGKGGHAFAKTLGEHNRNVRAWQAFKKQQNQ